MLELVELLLSLNTTLLVFGIRLVAPYTLAHGKNRLTFKRLLKDSYLEACRSQIKCFNPRCTDCCDNI